MNSPEFIQTSLAAAISLGFEPGSFKEPVRLTGLNLLLTYENGCMGKCAYCGISATGHNSINAGAKLRSEAINGITSCIGKEFKKTFIRVKWPVYRLEDVLDALKSRQYDFERVCLSMITHKDALRDTLIITEKIKNSCRLPISLLITPTLINSPEILKKYRQAGAGMAGIAIDTSTQQIFEKYRGRGVGGPHKWQKYWEVLKWSVEVFGKYRAGIHLIAGLGETEKEAVNIIYDAHVLGAKTHLFSFYPEAQSGLENLSPPELISYRKIQIARYLINDENLDISKISFDQQGRIVSFDYDIAKTLEQGYAFMTSGCPCSTNSRIAACNRPFANERPSEPFRNYPYLPSEDDKTLIAGQISEILPLKI
ncbi:MAG: radical SAM protein [Actinobacteria bacterium]|nr:radical SAM protein [Actinomycetota bacterium]